MVARAKFRGATNARCGRWRDRQPRAGSGEDLELKMGENWRRTGTVLAAVQLDDGRLLVQVVMNNDMEADSVFRVRDDAEHLSIEPLPYSLEE
jgi:folate-binding Fe-S cluster repair protein YgfZ